MPTKIQPLSDPVRKHLQTFGGSIFLDGECYAFAIALHRGLGWPMVGLMSSGIPRHVAARGPDKKLYDIRGPLDQASSEFGRPFHMNPVYTLQEVSEDDLQAVRPVQERSIDFARRTAEMLWPRLPWKESYAARVKAFADDLEALSKKHGLWIRSSVPAARPMLAKGEGDEGGYEIIPTDDAIGFMIDRYFR